MLAILCSVAALTSPPTGRRAVVQSAAALVTSLAPLSARSFDLPPVDQYGNPAERARYASMPNPSLGKQRGDVFYALTTGDIPMLNKMAENGWSLDAVKDTASKTALHRAAQLGNTAAIEVLLKSGAQVDAKTTWLETPLHFASRNGKLPVVKQLVEAGASLSAETYGGDTALGLARKYRMGAIEEYLKAL